MTEQEIARFALVLKEAARIRAEIAAEEAEDACGYEAAYLTLVPAENIYTAPFAA